MAASPLFASATLSTYRRILNVTSDRGKHKLG
jgi:hypothetical protein